MSKRSKRRAGETPDPRRILRPTSGEYDEFMRRAQFLHSLCDELEVTQAAGGRRRQVIVTMKREIDALRNGLALDKAPTCRRT